MFYSEMQSPSAATQFETMQLRQESHCQAVISRLVCTVNAWGLGVTAEVALVFWMQQRPFTNIIGEVAKLPQGCQCMDWSVDMFEDMLFVTT